MAYPACIDSFRTIQNVPGQIIDPLKTTRIYADDIQLLDSAVVAIETELGENPRGTFGSVAAFLNALSVQTNGIYNEAAIFTRKIIIPRALVQTSTPTLQMRFSNSDFSAQTAQAVSLSMVNPSTFFYNGAKIIFRLKDNGTPQIISWGTEFRACATLPLPLLTNASETLYLTFIANEEDSCWDLIESIGGF